jgi:hypothetical protein
MPDEHLPGAEPALRFEFARFAKKIRHREQKKRVMRHLTSNVPLAPLFANSRSIEMLSA